MASVSTDLAIALQSAERHAIGVAGRCIEASEDYRLGPFMRGEMRTHFGDCDTRRRLAREAVHAGRDRRKGDGAEALVAGDRQTRPVAIRQNVGFGRIAAAPDRSDGVDDMSRPQFVPAGQPRLAWRAAAERVA